MKKKIYHILSFSFILITILFINVNRAYALGAAPSVPGDVISSSHTVSVESTVRVIVISWTASTDVDSDLAGYKYLLDTTADTDPAVSAQAITAGVGTLSYTSSTLNDGSYYFHIIAYDGNANNSSVVHLGPLKIETTPTITAFEPTQFINNVQEQILITGTKFLAGCKVYVGTTESTETQVFDSGATLIATMPFNVSIGVQDLKVVNPSTKETVKTAVIRVLAPAGTLNSLSDTLFDSYAGRLSAHTINLTTQNPANLKYLEMIFPDAFTVPTSPVGTALGLGTGKFEKIDAVKASWASGPSLNSEAGAGAMSFATFKYRRLLIPGNASVKTALLDYNDPKTIAVTNGPDLTAPAFYGAGYVPISAKKCLVVLGNNSNRTNIIDFSNPLGVTAVEGPTLPMNVYYGGIIFLLAESRALVVAGNNSPNTAIINFSDLNNITSMSGPTLTGAASNGCFALRVAPIKVLVALGNYSKITNIIDFSNVSSLSVTTGPTLTSEAFVGAGGFQMDDNHFLIMFGNNSSGTSILNTTDSNFSFSTGPTLNSTIQDGAFTFPIDKKQYLIVHGGSRKTSDVVDFTDVSKLTVTAAPDLSGDVFSGGLMFALNENTAVAALGNVSKNTGIYTFAKPAKLRYTVTTAVYITGSTILSMQIGKTSGAAEGDTFKNPDIWGQYSIQAQTLDENGNLIDGPNSVSVTILEPPLTTTVAYFPYIVNKTGGSSQMQLRSSGTAETKFDLTAYNASGSKIGSTKRVVINGEGTANLVLDSNAFGSNPPTDTPYWLELNSNSENVDAAINMIFTGANSAPDVVGLPLSSASTNMVLPYAVDSSGYATSLTITNPGLASAKITVKCRSASGLALGEATRTINSREQVSMSLSSWVSGFAGKNGWVSITSDQPVCAVAIFENPTTKNLMIHTLTDASDLPAETVFPLGVWLKQQFYTTIIITNPDEKEEAEFSIAGWDASGASSKADKLPKLAPGAQTVFVISADIVPEGFGWLKVSATTGKVSCMTAIINYAPDVSEDVALVPGLIGGAALAKTTLYETGGTGRADEVIYLCIANPGSSALKTTFDALSSADIVVATTTKEIAPGATAFVPLEELRQGATSTPSFFRISADGELLGTELFYTTALNRWRLRLMSK